VYLYREFTRDKSEEKLVYSEQARRVKERMEYTTIENGIESTVTEKVQYIVAGLDAWNKHHRDQSGKNLLDYYREGGLTGFTKAVTDRKVRKATMHEYLRPMYDEITHTRYSKLQIFRRACPVIIENIPDLIEDEKDPETVMDCSYDHSYDGCTYGIISYHISHSTNKKEDKTGLWAIKDKLAKGLERKHRKKYR